MALGTSKVSDVMTIVFAFPTKKKTKTRRVMAEPKAMVVVLMLVAEMVMARVVVEMVIAENQMGWRGGQ
jgi:hypothetical protein